MARKKQESETGSDSSGWLTTYTDLCTLLMTFFVLLLSMATVDENRKREALNSLVGAFGMLSSGRSPTGTEKGQDVRESSAPLESPQTLDFKLLKEITLKNNLDKDIDVVREGDKLVLRISERVLFRPDSNDLRMEARAFLQTLGYHLLPGDREVEIRGHTDRYEGLKHPSWPQHSWKVSVERAQAVSRFFLDQGLEPNRISAHGFSYYWPVSDGERYPHLRHKNRRVEILLGRNDTIPSRLFKEKPIATPYFNYKNFFFRLFPQKDKKTDPSKAEDGEEHAP